MFKRVLYKQFNTNQDFYNRKDRISYAEKRNILTASNSQDYSNFRLEPNWNTPEDNQTIRLCISLDAIDLQNIKNIQDHIVKLNSVASSYTTI